MELQEETVGALGAYVESMPIWFILGGAFKAWMLFDAIQRTGRSCGNNYWFLICWIPFGDWVYFFAVKIHDPAFAKHFKWATVRRVSLDDLRYSYKVSQSAVNRLTLAQALHDAGKFDEALPLAEELLKSDPESKVYLYLLASCFIGLKQLEPARTHLEKLTAKDLDFKDFNPAGSLAAVYVEEGKPELAVELYRRIIRSSSQLRFQIDLSRLLAQTGKADEAKRILDDAIQQFRHEPRFIQKRDRKDLGTAKKVRKMLDGQVVA